MLLRSDRCSAIILLSSVTQYTPATRCLSSARNRCMILAVVGRETRVAMRSSFPKKPARASLSTVRTGTNTIHELNLMVIFGFASQFPVFSLVDQIDDLKS